MKVWIAAVASLALVGAASAQPAGGGGVRQACKADIEKLCSDVQAGHGAIRQCMRQHQDSLSDGCKAAMANARAQRREQGGQHPDGGQQPEAGPPPSPEQ